MLIFLNHQFHYLIFILQYGHHAKNINAYYCKSWIEVQTSITYTVKNSISQKKFNRYIARRNIKINTVMQQCALLDSKTQTINNHPHNVAAATAFLTTTDNNE